MNINSESTNLPPYKWLNTSEYVSYLLSEKRSCPLLQSERAQETLSYFSQQPDILLDQLLSKLSEDVQINEISFNERQISSLLRLSQIAFLRKDDKLLPAEYYQRSAIRSNEYDQLKVFFLSPVLPKRKLSKVQFVQSLMDRRWSIVFLALGLGTLPIVAGACAELLEQPLFDNFVPEGRIPPIILVGIASIALQLSSQLFTTIRTLAQSYFSQNIDLETRVATTQRYLDANPSVLPQKDIGSWRLTFSVASAFLGSINSLFISIPLAILSMIINIFVIGAFTDLSAIWNLFLILLVASCISAVISYFGSYVSIRVYGQQSSLETIIYDTVKQIRGIWLSNTEMIYIDRFTRARSGITRSLLLSGRLEASSSALNSLFQGLMYSFIFLQYYRSYLDPTRADLSVGSLLVIYSATGTLGASLLSITQDLVSIAQSLPTYWMPNAIRDISLFRSSSTGQSATCPATIGITELTYTAGEAEYPFSHPFSLSLMVNRHYALVGPSGSGKSTLLNLLIGHLTPRSGSIHLYDNNQQQLGGSLTDCRLLVLCQEPSIYCSCLSDVVDPSRQVPIEHLEEACKKLRLNGLLDSLPLRWKTPVNEFSRDLSLGQLQRFKIARALIKDYYIIISDEATCHLPEDEHLAMIKLLNKSCKMHLSVVHRTSALHLFDEVILIDRSGNVSLSNPALVGP